VLLLLKTRLYTCYRHLIVDTEVELPRGGPDHLGPRQILRRVQTRGRIEILGATFGDSLTTPTRYVVQGRVASMIPVRGAIELQPINLPRSISAIHVDAVCTGGACVHNLIDDDLINEIDDANLQSGVVV
jgi:hypothetical protein